jgi:hypothetical protein
LRRSISFSSERSVAIFFNWPFSTSSRSSGISHGVRWSFFLRLLSLA